MHGPRRRVDAGPAQEESRAVNGKHLAIGLLVALVLLLGFVFWVGANGQRDGSPPRTAAPSSGMPRIAMIDRGPDAV